MWSSEVGGGDTNVGAVRAVAGSYPISFIRANRVPGTVLGVGDTKTGTKQDAISASSWAMLYLCAVSFSVFSCLDSFFRVCTPLPSLNSSS